MKMITLAERKQIARLVLTTDDQVIIRKIKALVTPEVKQKEAHLKKYNRELAEAVAEIKSGKYLTQTQADNLLQERESE